MPLSPQEAYDLQQQVKEKCVNQRAMWVPVAEPLARFHAAKGWKELGNDTFQEWLGQPEIGLTSSEAYVYIGAWNELVLDRGVPVERLAKLAWTKVQDILAALRRDAAPLEELLTDCEVLSKSDLRARYSNPSAAEYYVCELCGSRVQKKDES